MSVRILQRTNDKIYISSVMLDNVFIKQTETHTRLVPWLISVRLAHVSLYEHSAVQDLTDPVVFLYLAFTCAGR